MKLVYCYILLILSLTVSALAIPPMPDLEEAIANDKLVTINDLKLQNAEIELDLAINAFARIDGITPDEVRVKYDNYLSVLEWTAGGKRDIDKYNAFYESVSPDDPNPQFRFMSIFKELNTHQRDAVRANKLRLCLLEMEELGYSPWRIAGAAISYRTKMLKVIEYDDSTDEIDRFYFERVAALAANTEMTTSSRWRIWENFIEEFITTSNQTRRDTLLEVFESTENIDPWVLYMVRAEHARTVAWAIRGKSYAYKVSPEAMGGFHDHLEQSMHWIEKACEIDPMCPSTPALMLKSLYPNGTLWEAEGYKWVERTMIACIDYTEAFDTLRHLLQPKWHGDWESHREVAIWSNRPDLYHTRFPYESFRFLDKVMRNYGVDNQNADAFWVEEKELIDSVMQALEGMLANDAPISETYVHTLLAYFHYRHTGDLIQTDKHIRACTNGLSSNAKRYLGWDDFRIEATVLPFVGPTAVVAKSAQRHEKACQYEQAIDKWTSVLRIFESMDDERGQAAAREHIQRIKWIEEYESSGWVDLKFDEHMSGWWIHEGNWKRENESTAIAEQRFSERETLLIAEFQPGKSFEYTADVQFVGDPEYNSTLSIVFYRGHRKTDHYDMQRSVSARMVRRKEGSIGWGFGRTDYNMPIDIPDDYKFKLRVIVQDDQVEGYVNGIRVGKGEVPNFKREKEPDITRIGIGSWDPGKRGHAVFTNIKIRKYEPSDELDF